MTETITDLPTKVLRARADVRIVHLARDLVDEAVDSWEVAEDHRDDMRLVFSELVTNAVEAAPGTVITATIVLRDPSTIRFNVWDSNTKDRVVVKKPDEMDETGRGLLLVTALSSAYGVIANTRQNGKWVWAEMRVEGRPSDLP